MMGFDFGLADPSACFKRKFRWLFMIPYISASGVNSLPPSKSARPSFSFKEMEAQHVAETVYFPSKPEFKPVNLTLYDLTKPGQCHPVFNWINQVYDPTINTGDIWGPSCDGFKQDQALLQMYDGCGNVIETWIYENAWVQSAEFGELDYSQSEVLMCDLTLRYDRAYIQCSNPAGFGTPIPQQTSFPIMRGIPNGNGSLGNGIIGSNNNDNNTNPFGNNIGLGSK